MALNGPSGRTLLVILLASTDVLLAASLPLLFFSPSIAILMFLAFPAGLALARWQYGKEPWEMRRGAAITTLISLAGLVVLFFLLVVAGRTRPGLVEAAPALMFLAIAWAGLSTYAIGLVSLRANGKPAASTYS